MATIAELEVKLTTELEKVKSDLAKFKSDLDKSHSHVNKASNSMQKAFKAIGVAIAAIGVSRLAKEMVKLASDAEETRNKFNVVFQNIKADADAAAENLNKNFGLSRQASEDLLSGVGDLLTGFGLTQEEALKLADAASQLGADLASFTNYTGGAKGATEALAAAMLGERERVKTLGIALTETDLKKFAEEQGKNWDEMDRGAKATLTLEMAMRQSKNAIGDFARSQDSFANVSKRVQSRLQDIGAEIGAQLLPALSDLGLAFLRASQDGGVIVKIVDFITSSIKVATNAVSKFTNTLNGMGKMSQIKKLDEEINMLTAEFKALRDEGVVSKAELKELLAEREKLIKQRQVLQTGVEELVTANTGLQESMKKEIALIGDIIAGREYEKTKHIENEVAKTQATVEQVEERKQIEIMSAQEVASKIISITQSLTSQLSSLYSIYYSNKMIQLDNERYASQTKIDEEYAAKRKQIEDTIKDETEREAALEKLDEEYAANKDKVDKEMDKKERQLKREAAKTTKKLAIFETLINIPQMAANAYKAMAGIPYVGPILGAAAAIAATGFGLAKLKLIQDQPLPEAAEGGVFNTPYIGGEAGKEMAVPLEGDNGRNAIQQLASGMLDAMSQIVDTRATVSTSAGESSGGGGNIYLDGSLVGKWIARASDNGLFTLNKRVLI